MERTHSISMCNKNHYKYYDIYIKEASKCEIEHVNYFSKSSTQITENYGKISCQEKKKRSVDPFYSSKSLSEKHAHLQVKKKKVNFLQLQDSHSRMIPTI